MDQDYPNVLLRVKAIVTDYFVMLVFMFSVAFIFSHFEQASENIRMGAFLFIFVFYDPIFTSFFGGTIGHKLNGLAVKRVASPEKNVNIILATVRFLVKSSLGVISLLVISANDQRRAIHDIISGSVVIFDINK